MKIKETEAERKKKDDLIRETIMAKLIETGEKDRLKGKRYVVRVKPIVGCRAGE